MKPRDTHTLNTRNGTRTRRTREHGFLSPSSSSHLPCSLHLGHTYYTTFYQSSVLNSPLTTTTRPPTGSIFPLPLHHHPSHLHPPTSFFLQHHLLSPPIYQLRIKHCLHHHHHHTHYKLPFIYRHQLLTYLSLALHPHQTSTRHDTHSIEYPYRLHSLRTLSHSRSITSDHVHLSYLSADRNPLAPYTGIKYPEYVLLYKRYARSKIPYPLSIFLGVLLDSSSIHIHSHPLIAHSAQV